MPIDYSKYPPNWKTEIRPRILERANHCCEKCGIANYSMRQGLGEYAGLIKIILTIAHLDHDETNWEVKDERLKALCQRCHLRYDVPEKQIRRQEKKDAEDPQLNLFEENK